MLYFVPIRKGMITFPGTSVVRLKYLVHCLVWTDDLPCQGADLNFRALLPLLLQENYIFLAQKKTNFCQL